MPHELRIVITLYTQIKITDKQINITRDYI